MRAQRASENELILGLISISDRASRGDYQDQGIPALTTWCQNAITTPVQIHQRLIADDRYTIEETIRELVDRVGCDLVFTTGGTGPSRRDVTPEATLAVGTREMPGFGEQMRRISLNFVPTAILSRQVAVLRETPDHAALIVNLPGQPKSIAETLGGYRAPDGEVIDAGIFAAIPYCIDLIGGPYIETNPAVVEAFRPKSARKPQPAPEASSAPKTSSTMSAKPIHPHPNIQPLALDANISNPMDFAAGLAATQRPVQTPATPRPPRNENIPRMSQTLIERRSVQRVPLTNANARNLLEPLEIITKEPESGKADCTLIWLHGLGADAHDFETFAQDIRAFGGPNVRLILPNAPHMYLRIRPDFSTRAWFDVLSEDFGSGAEDLAGLARMHLRVSQIINQTITQGTLAQRIFIGGFSQGAAMSLYCAMRQARTLAGCIALSGWLPAAGQMARDLTPGGRSTPVFMAHGAFDEVVSPMYAERSSKIVEDNIDSLIWREYPMSHELCEAEMNDIAQFMKMALTN